MGVRVREGVARRSQADPRHNAVGPFGIATGAGDTRLALGRAAIHASKSARDIEIQK